MAETTITMTELRRHLGEFINRAAYGKESIVLVSHGQPKAVIVNYDEFRRLQNQGERTDDPWEAVLEAAASLRERVQHRYEVEGITPEDSTETLRQLREEQLN